MLFDFVLNSLCFSFERLLKRTAWASAEYCKDIIDFSLKGRCLLDGEDLHVLFLPIMPRAPCRAHYCPTRGAIRSIIED